jgi:hypothetical protein
MTPVLDRRAADRLTKLLGMLGSSHNGERAAAALKADELVRELNLTWRDVIRLPKALPTNDTEKVALALANIDLLTEWEQDFIFTIRWRQRISQKQRVILNQIVDEIAEARSC